MSFGFKSTKAYTKAIALRQLTYLLGILGMEHLCDRSDPDDVSYGLYIFQCKALLEQFYKRQKVGIK